MICHHIPTGMLSYAPVCRPCPKSLPWFLLSSLVLPFTFIWWSCFPFHWKTKTKQTTTKHSANPKTTHLHLWSIHSQISIFVFVLTINYRLFHVRPSPLIANQIPSPLTYSFSHRLFIFFLPISSLFFPSFYYLKQQPNMLLYFSSKKMPLPQFSLKLLLLFFCFTLPKDKQRKMGSKSFLYSETPIPPGPFSWIHSNSTLTISTPPELLLLKLLRTLFLSYSTAQQYLTQLITPSC